MGVIYRERQGMRVTISDVHVGLAFELPYARVAAILEALIERPVATDFTFASAFSFATEPPGALPARSPILTRNWRSPIPCTRPAAGRC